jgi:putative protease
VYPALEVHGSTQMTVHDVSGARVMQQLGIERVVLARENTIEDIREIHSAVPSIGLESFVHGALCISYSGQCFMSGMISERSANRGSCAQSCRKDYVLTDHASGTELDRGYLISAKDLAAQDHLAEIAQAGIGCLKVEGRKKKPEYVATVTQSYRGWLNRLRAGEFVAPPTAEVEPLVQIFSRGFTGGMYGGRAGRDYITRNQPDNRGSLLGLVTERRGREFVVELRAPLADGDGVGFEAPMEGASATVGGTVHEVRILHHRGGAPGVVRQSFTLGPMAPAAAKSVGEGWRLVRTSDVTLLSNARASFEQVVVPEQVGRVRMDIRCFGQAGAPLKVVVSAAGELVTVRSSMPLAAATKRALDVAQLREQLGRLGGTEYVLGALQADGLAPDCFLPVSALNRMRQEVVEKLDELRSWSRSSNEAERLLHIQQVVADVPTHGLLASHENDSAQLAVSVCTIDDAIAAADAGATCVTLDPFLRHPAPSIARVRELQQALDARGVAFRLRTPTIVRPEDRRHLSKWLALRTPVLTGHLGLLAELSADGIEVTGDYALNVFNAHTAATLHALGAARLTASVELTLAEIGQLVAPWNGRKFEVLVWGRPEGMTIEHCVLSAAFDREPTTCRDLCVQKHPNVMLTDPAGYTFPVATDSDCRNRLLHSRPVDGAEFLPALWSAGIRRFQLVFNVPGDPVSEVTRAYADMLVGIAAGTLVSLDASRVLMGRAFTRGHFVRAV